MTETIWTTALIVLCLVGVLVTVVRLPGTWLIVASTAAYSWHHDWSRPDWKVVVALVTAATVAEVLELLTSVVTARKAGASKRASWGGLVGGFAGMFVFTFPLPLIGTIIGGVLGCFLGAMIAELSVRDDFTQGARVGMFAAFGQVLGSVLKTMIALIMAGTAIVMTIL